MKNLSKFFLNLYLKCLTKKLNYLNICISNATRKPNKPKIAIPIAETLAVVRNSSFVGFFKTNQTLLHFLKKLLNFPIIELYFLGF